MTIAPSTERPAAAAVCNQRGVALLIVLVIVALLTVTVTEFTYSVQIDMHRSRNAVHALQAQLLARSGVNLAEGFLMLDDEPTYDAYSEEWYRQLLEFCKGMKLDESMHVRCRVRDESGKLNINNTRGVRRRVESQQVTGDAVLRDAVRCLFNARGLDPTDLVERIAEYWQQEPPQNANGEPSVIPEFTSLEDFGATFGIPADKLHALRNVMTAQPSRLLPRININTAPAEVIAAVLNQENVPDCPSDDVVAQIAERQSPDTEQPFRSAGDISGVVQGGQNTDLKRRLFDVRSRLYRLEASALTNVDPANPTHSGIGQTLSVLVSRQQDAHPRPGAQQTGPNGKPVPNWTLRPLDWQKEGGARLFRSVPSDGNLPGSPDDEEELKDGAAPD